MSEEKKDLTIPKNLVNWIMYGLAGVVSAVSSVAYIDMRNQRDKLQVENNYFARQSFDAAILKKTVEVQEELLMIQDTAISESKNYIKDSIEAVNVKNVKSNIKIKRK